MSALKVERSGNAEWGKVILPYNNKNYKFPCYFPKKEIFNFDPDPVIRFKCVLLTAVTPIVSVIRSVYWLAKAALMSVAELFYYVDKLKWSPTGWDDVKVTAYDSVRALGYGAKMTGYASTGIIAPFWARRHYGQLERELNHQPDGPHRGMFYLAFCFQRLALVPDDNNWDKVQAKLIKHIDFVRKVQTSIPIGPALFFPGLRLGQAV